MGSRCKFVVAGGLLMNFFLAMVGVLKAIKKFAEIKSMSMSRTWIWTRTWTRTWTWTTDMDMEVEMEHRHVCERLHFKSTYTVQHVLGQYMYMHLCMAMNKDMGLVISINIKFNIFFIGIVIVRNSVHKYTNCSGKAQLLLIFRAAIGPPMSWCSGAGSSAS